jgi:hypothetical protein
VELEQVLRGRESQKCLWMKKRKASSSKDVEMSYIPVSLEIDVQHGESAMGSLKQYTQ